MPILRRPSRPSGRRFRPLRLLVLALAIMLGLAVPALAADPAPRPTPVPAPPGLAEFMGGLAQIESGGRYDARNPDSGAYGKYQIMPANWPAWARRYLRMTKAPTTPRNQERVAAGRITDLYRAYGAWDRTAYWWLTGKRGPRETWSHYATHYVDNVMAGYRMRRATPPPGGVRRLSDGGGTVRYAGAWGTARHPAYIGGGVHYATAAGAAVGVRFVGREHPDRGSAGPDARPCRGLRRRQAAHRGRPARPDVPAAIRAGVGHVVAAGRALGRAARGAHARTPGRGDRPGGDPRLTDHHRARAAPLDEARSPDNVPVVRPSRSMGLHDARRCHGPVPGRAGISLREPIAVTPGDIARVTRAADGADAFAAAPR